MPCDKKIVFSPDRAVNYKRDGSLFLHRILSPFPTVSIEPLVGNGISFTNFVLSRQSHSLYYFKTTYPQKDIKILFAKVKEHVLCNTCSPKCRGLISAHYAIIN